jgi:carboxyl-terminal processing protease
VTIGFVEPSYDLQGKVTSYANLDPITISTVSDYSEDPVYMDSILTIGGHKIGYFVYHFFSPDNGSNDNSYDLEMNDVFGNFKSKGITDLILDLRYNSGGHTTSAQLLASELVPDISDSKLFVSYQYNSQQTAYFVNKYGSDALKTFFTTKVLDKDNNSIGTVNNVGNLIGGKLYILTGPHTASASEQIINGLKPFLDVVLIGDTTYGKNVASSTFYDKVHSYKNKWGLQPIVAKFFNSQGKSDFTAGFAPNYVVRDGGFNMKELGDPNEPLLNTALNAIVGSQTLPIVRKRVESIQVDKLLAVPGKRIRGLQLDKMPFFE